MTLSSIALIGVPAATADEQQTTAEQNTAAKPSVIINEVYAGNTKAAGDPDSKRCDWVELKNTGSTDVDVKGWGIYDSGKKAKKHYTIGTSEVTNTDTVIKAGGYLVAYIDPDKAKPAKTCDAAADMKVSSIKSDNLIVTILATSNCDDKNASTKFNDSATRLTLQDSDDNVVADAVFDFSGDNAKTISGDTGTKIKVSYASSQYYRPANEIGANPSDLSVKSVTGSDKGAGAAASSDSGVISGSNVTDDEAENNASKALDWQVEHDKDSAELFYSTYTAQLSSKRKGMEAEGKTWNYRDILAQFITMHNKNSNVLLIWSGDWPAYSSNSDKYYVILAGEGFDSTDEAWNWCKANNYGPNDCMSIDLQ